MKQYMRKINDSVGGGTMKAHPPPPSPLSPAFLARIQGHFIFCVDNICMCMTHKYAQIVWTSIAKIQYVYFTVWYSPHHLAPLKPSSLALATHHKIRICGMNTISVYLLFVDNYCCWLDQQYLNWRNFFLYNLFMYLTLTTDDLYVCARRQLSWWLNEKRTHTIFFFTLFSLLFRHTYTATSIQWNQMKANLNLPPTKHFFVGASRKSIAAKKMRSHYSCMFDRYFMLLK